MIYDLQQYEFLSAMPASGGGQKGFGGYRLGGGWYCDIETYKVNWKDRCKKAESLLSAIREAIEKCWEPMDDDGFGNILRGDRIVDCINDFLEDRDV